jgi:hypothetical protein
VEGFTTMILLQLIVGSVIMVALGIIGEYLSIIYNGSQRTASLFPAESIQAEKRTTHHERMTLTLPARTGAQATPLPLTARTSIKRSPRAIPCNASGTCPNNWS